MTEIINLRQARKAKKRAADAAVAASNRARFGRTKGEKQKQDAEAVRQARELEGKRREGKDGDEG